MRKYWLFRNIANFITISRLFSVIYLAWVGIFNCERLDIFFFGFLYIGLSDLLDGFLARILKIQSKFGEIVDPVIDKVAIFSLVPIMFWRYYPVIESSLLKRWTDYSFFAVVVVEMAIATGVAIISTLKQVDIKSNEWGRKKFAFLCFAVYAWVFSVFLEKYWSIEIFQWALSLMNLFLLATMILGIISIKEYWEKAFR